MKVLLKKDLLKVGKVGEVVEVSDGYGANYVIPQGYGVLFTAAALKTREKELAAEAALRAEKTSKAQEVATLLSQKTFKFVAPVGNRGAMIGTVSIKELKKALKQELGVSVDKEAFPEHNIINSFGLSHVKIELFKGVFGIMNVLVEPKPSDKK